MNCIQMSQQADKIASTFSKHDLAKLVVALKGSGDSLQQAVGVIDTLDARQGFTLSDAWAEVRAGEPYYLSVGDDD